MLETPKDVLALIRDKGVVAVDLWFMDTNGREQHITIPSDELDEAAFSEGFNSYTRIRGWSMIWDYDFRIVPIPETAFLDPFRKHKTLVLLCEIVYLFIQEPCTRDPRYIGRKAVNYLQQKNLERTPDVLPLVSRSI